jgi:hypothetical protein
MATDRSGICAVTGAAVPLIWPAVWNGYPIVFADTGTYLSQAIHLYAGWDRPVFYSLFLLPLHWTVTLWPVVVVQALLTAWILWLVCRVLVPNLSAGVFVVGTVTLAASTWLPWIVSEVMPDLFTPLLVLIISLLAWVPERLTQREQIVLATLATCMITSQQSSVPLACALLTVLGSLGFWIRKGVRPNCREANDTKRQATCMAGRYPTSPRRRILLLVLPPVLAVFGMCSANLAAHGRFAVSPFGNIFLLARVIYDGPGMTTLRRDCGTAGWRLCQFLDGFPASSDGFLWSDDSPLYQAGGPKIVAAEADAIIQSAIVFDPVGQVLATLGNTLEQLQRFESGDGLEPWPTKVSPWIEQDFPAREYAAYSAARQQIDRLNVPPALTVMHRAAALAGIAAAIILLPAAMRRRAPCAGFLLAVLLSLVISAAITGGLSAPHDRYQSRIMWLPLFMAIVSLASLQGDTDRFRTDGRQRTALKPSARGLTGLY